MISTGASKRSEVAAEQSRGETFRYTLAEASWVRRSGGRAGISIETYMITNRGDLESGGEVEESL
jgi:hypothetical protein